MKVPGIVLPLALLGSLATAADPALDLTVTARALHPGEVVRLDLRAADALSAIRATAFDRTWTFYLLDGRWRALVGIDLEVEPGEHAVVVEATTAAGTVLSETRSLRVAPKAFATRQLRVAPRYVDPPPDVQARIRKERERLVALYAVVGPAPAWDRPFIRPIAGAVISGFGRRSVFNGQPRAPHSGADFRSPAGTPVKAPNAGQVTLADDLYFTGRTVVIDHGVGVQSVLAHLSRIDVVEGDRVERGAVVGAVGATGRVTGPHLHWTVRLNGTRVDPLSLIHALTADE